MDINNLKCQTLLQCQPDISGWVRVKGNLSLVGEPMSENNNLKNTIIKSSAKIKQKITFANSLYFFVIKNSVLYIFKNETDNIFEKSINFYENVTSALIINNLNCDNMRWPIEVIFGSATNGLIFSGATQMEQENWLTVFSKDLNQNMNNSAINEMITHEKGKTEYINAASISHFPNFSVLVKTPNLKIKKKMKSIRSSFSSIVSNTSNNENIPEEKFQNSRGLSASSILINSSYKDDSKKIQNLWRPPDPPNLSNSSDDEFDRIYDEYDALSNDAEIKTNITDELKNLLRDKGLISGSQKMEILEESINTEKDSKFEASNDIPFNDDTEEVYIDTMNDEDDDDDGFWYKSCEEASKLLTTLIDNDGTFLIRISTSKDYYTLCIIHERNIIKFQIRLEKDYIVLDCNNKKFDNILELTRFYKSNYLPIINKRLNKSYKNYLY